MPNWCENILTIQTNSHGADVVKKALEGPEGGAYYIIPQYRNMYKPEDIDLSGHFVPGHTILSFVNLIPIPIQALEFKNPDFHLDLDKLPEENIDQSILWGTKWHPTDIDLFDDDHELEYVFSSAWSPPIPIAKAISEKFPDAYVTLKYVEFGCEFGGYHSYQNGMLVDHLDVENNTEALRAFAIQHMNYDEGSFDDWDL